jgi:hypothetical protein
MAVFLSVSFHWLGAGLFLYPLSLDSMTTLLVTAYITKPVHKPTYFNPDDGSSMFL